MKYAIPGDDYIRVEESSMMTRVVNAVMAAAIGLILGISVWNAANGMFPDAMRDHQGWHRWFLIVPAAVAGLLLLSRRSSKTVEGDITAPEAQEALQKALSGRKEAKRHKLSRIDSKALTEALEDAKKNKASKYMSTADFLKAMAEEDKARRASK